MASANFGEQLRQAREKRQLTLKQVEGEIKIGADLLQAFENNNFNFDFPQIYRRGFLKTYVQFLGLNVEKFLAQIDALEDSDGDAKVESRATAKAAKKVKVEVPPDEKEDGDGDGEEEVDSSPKAKGRDIWKVIAARARDRRWQCYGAVLLLTIIGGFFILRPSPGRDLEWDELLDGDGADVVLIGANAPKKLTIIASDEVKVLVREKKTKQRIHASSLKKGASEEVSIRENVQISYSDGNAISIRLENGELIKPKKAGAG
ncbi:MAG: helix-turn-helix domain-containing protein, partial [Puniceicoccales bacterium]|nr:helix-turn-helix domain-containing protein [Puniceicoccales bacterium]